ncbi:MAG: hypothetical protein ACUVWX_02425 [Kiritimatiellia bacterium]
MSKPELNRIVKFLFIALGLLVFTAGSLKFLPVPWLWIFAVWFLGTVLLLGLSCRRLVRITLLGWAAVLLVLTMAEAALSLLPPNTGRKGGHRIEQKGTIRERYWQRNDILGYAPLTNVVATSVKYADGHLLYDVTYSIDQHGLRVCPPPRPGARADALLFFGCSLTFGEGVNDNETLPYQVALLSHQEYAVYNFGFHGYGPHQMLAAFEHGLVDRIVTNRIACVIYQAIGGHVRRVTGQSPWDTHGPAYRLNRAGKAVYAGHFDDPKGRVATWLEWQLEKSAIWRRLLTWQRPLTSRDIRLFAAIVEKTRDIVEQRYRGCEFHVIFWDEKRAYEPIVKALAERGIRLHRISAILPELAVNPSMYKIPVDNHPVPAAYRAIAEYVVRRIVKPTNLGKSSAVAGNNQEI